jgi:hypothetical protein
MRYGSEPEGTRDWGVSVVKLLVSLSSGPRGLQDLY